MSEKELDDTKREISPEKQSNSSEKTSAEDPPEPGVLYTPEGDEIKPKKEKNGKRRRIFIIGGGVLLLAVIIGVIYWLYSRQFESTDDAVVEADVTQVAPKVSAYVTKIYVNGNQYVHKGDPLVDLDPSDLQVKLRQAKAQLETA